MSNILSKVKYSASHTPSLATHTVVRPTSNIPEPTAHIDSRPISNDREPSYPSTSIAHTCCTGSPAQSIDSLADRSDTTPLQSVHINPASAK